MAIGDVVFGQHRSQPELARVLEKSTRRSISTIPQLLNGLHNKQFDLLS
jgi:hypothetical protein